MKPIVLEYKDGEAYTLEFSRETVAMAEDNGFRRDDASEKLMVRVPQLFYFAFKKNHPAIPRSKTDQILFEDLGGVSEDMLGRLLELLESPYETLINTSGKVKNPQLTVKM